MPDPKATIPITMGSESDEVKNPQQQIMQRVAVSI